MVSDTVLLVVPELNKPAFRDMAIVRLVLFNALPVVC
jgi:hypothetical protein